MGDYVSRTEPLPVGTLTFYDRDALIRAANVDAWIAVLRDFYEALHITIGVKDGSTSLRSAAESWTADMANKMADNGLVWPEDE